MVVEERRACRVTVDQGSTAVVQCGCWEEKLSSLSTQTCSRRPKLALIDVINSTSAFETLLMLPLTRSRVRENTQQDQHQGCPSSEAVHEGQYSPTSGRWPLRTGLKDMVANCLTPPPTSGTRPVR